jgi:hypothetical protein
MWLIIQQLIEVLHHFFLASVNTSFNGTHHLIAIKIQFCYQLSPGKLKCICYIWLPYFYYGQSGFLVGGDGGFVGEALGFFLKFRPGSFNDGWIIKHLNPGGGNSLYSNSERRIWD